MPKSSSARRTPRSLSRPILRVVSSVSWANSDSVISRVSRRRVEPRPLQRLGDVPDQVGVLELAHGDVDAHAQPAQRGAVLPLGGLTGRLLQHPPADRHDEAGLLGERDELQRGDQAALGVPPAQQRLEADDLLRRRRRRSAGSAAPAARRRGRRRARHGRRPARPRGVVARLEDLEPALAAGLGRVHGHVGGAQHADAAGRAGRRRRQADAEPGADEVVADRASARGASRSRGARRARPGARCRAR